MVWYEADMIRLQRFSLQNQLCVTLTFLEPNQGRAECTEVRVGWHLRNLGQQTGAWGKAHCNWQGRFHPLSPWDVNHTKTLMDLLPSNPQTEWQRKIHRQMNKPKKHMFSGTHTRACFCDTNVAFYSVILLCHYFINCTRPGYITSGPISDQIEKECKKHFCLKMSPPKKRFWLFIER